MAFPMRFHGNIYCRTPNSRDTSSASYTKATRWLRDEAWYDIHPYSLAVWPHRYAEILRRGNWWFQRSNYACIALELQSEGETVCESEGRREVLHPGELYVTLPGRDVRFSSGSSKFGRQFQLVISGGMVKLLVESLGMTECRKVVFGRSGELEELRSRFARIAELLAARRREQAAENSQLGYAIILGLAEKYSFSVGTDLPSVLTHAVWAMEADRGCHQSVSRLAADLGTSRATLTRMFRNFLGISPQAYWNKLRMESAVQLVRAGQLSFKEIAEQLGFRNSLYFSTVFHRYTGLTPTAFRARGLEETAGEMPSSPRH